jgi:hypothetical protein
MVRKKGKLTVKVYFQTIGIVKATWQSSQKKMTKSNFAMERDRT